MAGESAPDNCSIYLNQSFPPSYDGALLGLIFLEVLLMGYAEDTRTGLIENPFDDVVAGSVFPADASILNLTTARPTPAAASAR